MHRKTVQQRKRVLYSVEPPVNAQTSVRQMSLGVTSPLDCSEKRAGTVYRRFLPPPTKVLR